jgi:hypothetical protein
MALIQKKGYDKQEAEEMTRRIFDNMESDNNHMSFEFYAGRIIDKKAFIAEYRRN